MSYQIAFALAGVKVQVGKQFLKPGLTEAQRYEIAERTIENLRRLGPGWEWLDEPVGPAEIKPRWLGGKPNNGMG